MNKWFALVDCNNFYASCEKVFRPCLAGKPVVVMSNNDGCVISRSQEAKSLGIGMGVPVFQVTDIIRHHDVRLFSTNYALYGDFSQRVMNTLAGFTADLEIYSIDEAFLAFSGNKEGHPTDTGADIRDRIFRWTGIPVSVGTGLTKTLAKAANHLAKKDSSGRGVFDLTDTSGLDDILSGIPVHEVWGVGEKWSEKLERWGIRTARDLRDADEMRVRDLMGVVGQRIVMELRGVSCLPFSIRPEEKKEICTSRSFGRAVVSYHDLEAATSSYVARAAEKLRRQESMAGSLLVFVMTNKYARGPKYVNYKMIRLPVHTHETGELVNYARSLLKDLFREGYSYKKSGVILSELIPVGNLQSALWDDRPRSRERKLQEVLDGINRRMGRDKVKLAVQGGDDPWKMRQESLSPHYTTRWEDLPVVEMDDLPLKQ
ncbi:MAG: Y-family DNA polymerase [Bacteroidales bacterium]|nr:Y-family DNA polymerase [Bacteroidales bacterium]